MVQNERKRARRKGNKIHKIELVIPQEQRTNTLVLNHNQPAGPDTAPRLGQFRLSNEDSELEPHAESTLSAMSSRPVANTIVESLDESNVVDSDTTFMNMNRCSESTFFSMEDHHNVSLNIPANQHDSLVYGESFVVFPPTSSFYGDGTSFGIGHMDTLGLGNTSDVPGTPPGLLSPLHSSPSTCSWSPSYFSTPRTHSPMLTSPAVVAHTSLSPDIFDTRPTRREYTNAYQNETYTPGQGAFFPVQNPTTTPSYPPSDRPPDNLMPHQSYDLDGQRTSPRYRGLDAASNSSDDNSFRGRRTGGGPPRLESAGFHPYGRSPLRRSYPESAVRHWDNVYGETTCTPGDASTSSYALSMPSANGFWPSQHASGADLLQDAFSYDTEDHYHHRYPHIN